jgi:hypothetical protein
MTERVEQRHCIKFCQKLGDSEAETIRKIQQAFGDDAMVSSGQRLLSKSITKTLETGDPGHHSSTELP